MLCCFNPSCTQIDNADEQRFCTACGTPLRLKDRYQAVQLLGSGGFGRTFQGLDHSALGTTTQACAIKQLYIPNVRGAAQAKVLELFERESRWLYQLEEHPQTPKFIDYFAQDNYLYLIQELIVGQTLKQEINNRENPYSEAEVLSFLKEVIAILKYIHQYKIIHRDLKPDNLIRRESDQKWVLIDFGASRILSETALVGGATVIGTPEYMAPEQHRGKVLPASDLYSLGVICVQLLTGQSTLEMFDLQTNQWHWQDYLPPQQSISATFMKLIDQMIAPSLGDRLQTAYQVEQYLKRIERQQQIAPLTLYQSPQHPRLNTTKKIMVNHQPTIPILHQEEPQKLENAASQSDWELETLTQHLQRQRWQAADIETWRLILAAIAKNSYQYIFPQDISRIPCELLHRIDEQWLQASQAQFGFSQQLAIYRTVGGDYPQFCRQVGWSLQGSSRPELEFLFTNQAPVGHLPSRQKMGGAALWKNMQIFYEKLLDCDF